MFLNVIRIIDLLLVYAYYLIYETPSASTYRCIPGKLCTDFAAILYLIIKMQCTILENKRENYT